MDTAKGTVSVLLNVLQKHGVEEVVCSPGSRNTPLLIAAEARSELKKTVVVDERTAAFIALGKSMVSGKPVALICTSGTAVLNYGPALAEAYYQGVPLIAITADRPAEWIDQDDSQTLRQNEAFVNYVKSSYDFISGREDPDYMWYTERCANEGMILALKDKPGPVHFNIRLDDPLSVRTKLKDSSTVRQVRCLHADTLTREEVGNLAKTAAGKRILLVAGYHSPDNELNSAVRKFASLPNVAVMAETISNLHLDGECYSIDSVLSRLTEKAKEELKPEILITIGGAVVSRMLKEWLRIHKPQKHWIFSENDILADCYKTLTLKIEADPGKTMRRLAGAMIKIKAEEYNEEYGLLWKQQRQKAAKEKRCFVDKAPWSDLKAYDILFATINRSNANLFLSNGTSIRYAQILSDSIPHATFCNRGVSGIDGCTSTAIGGMTEYSGTTVMITGDMSFAYDIGALGSRLADGRMRIIVINNSGGGIFRFIKTTSQLPEREQYFCADPHVPVKGLAEAYGWDYFFADSVETLPRLEKFLKPSERPAILELKTPGELSGKLLKQLLNSGSPDNK